MRLFSADYNQSVDVGMGSIWYSLYSTVNCLFSVEVKKKIPNAIEFLRTGECTEQLLKKTKTEMETVIQGLSLIAPDKAVYDMERPEVAPPWKGYIAPTITSCANLFTTADGQDLLTEVMALFDYGISQNVAICAG